MNVPSSVPSSPTGDKVLSSVPLNYGVKISSVLAGQIISTKIEGGFCRRKAPEDGMIIETVEKDELFVPVSLLVKIGWRAS